MSYIISQVISLIKLLHSENGSKQIAAGLTLGLLLGLSPIASLQGLIIITLLFILKVQIGAAFAMAAVTKVLSVMMVATLAALGEKVLSMGQLRPLFTLLYNLPIFPYTNFNHSVVMGGFIFSLILGPALFFIFNYLINKYQVTAVEKIKKTSIWRAIQASTLYQWYAKYTALTK